MHEDKDSTPTTPTGVLRQDTADEDGSPHKDEPVAKHATTSSASHNLRILDEATPCNEAPDHTVMVDIDLLAKGMFVPTTDKNEPEGDNVIFLHEFVQLPFISGPHDSPAKRRRSDTVKASLEREIFTVDELLSAMESYCHGIMNECGAQYREFFLSFISVDEADLFFSKTLRKLQHLALKLPELIKRPIPILVQDKSSSVTLSQLQIASILANLFLNTFPGQIERLPTPINFKELFCTKAKDRRKCVFQKLRCLLNYFDRVCNHDNRDNAVSFHRHVLGETERPQWEKVEVGLSQCHISAKGLIEDQAGFLQVDFANRFIGGGVLRTGCVQEEIRFSICPELLVARVFTQALLDNEALIVQGFERYCHYSGYGNTFRFVSNYVDTTPIDDFMRRKTTLVAIDATRFRGQPFKAPDQFQAPRMLREMNKAYIGFKPFGEGKCASGVSPAPRTAVATGNWGCGAFGGNATLKFIIQWLAASYAGRDFAYSTFDNRELMEGLKEIVTIFGTRGYCVKDVWRLLCQYNRSDKSASLLEFISNN